MSFTTMDQSFIPLPVLFFPYEYLYRTLVITEIHQRGEFIKCKQFDLVHAHYPKLFPHARPNLQ